MVVVVDLLMKKMRQCCRRLFWRTRASLKKVHMFRQNKKHFRFHYDPSSYALNFDDGLHLNTCSTFKHFGAAPPPHLDGFEDHSDHAIAAAVAPACWVFILLVKTI